VWQTPVEAALFKQVPFQESEVTQVAALFQDGYGLDGTDESD
jgi:hypothetical protein